VGRFCVAVTALVHQRSYSTSTPISTRMGERLPTGKPSRYVTIPAGLTQPPTLNETGNEYQPKFGDSVQPESKDKYGSLQLLMHVWVGGKTLLTRAITEHLRGEFLSV